jgi:hypothetical protein
MSPYLYPVIETAEIETTFLELASQWRSRDQNALRYLQNI